MFQEIAVFRAVEADTQAFVDILQHCGAIAIVPVGYVQEPGDELLSILRPNMLENGQVFERFQCLIEHMAPPGGWTRLAFFAVFEYVKHASPEMTSPKGCVCPGRTLERVDSHRQYTVDGTGFSGKDRIQPKQPMPSMLPDTPRRSLHALPPGTVLHDYIIDSELGSGGFSNNNLAQRRDISGWLFAVR